MISDREGPEYDLNQTQSDDITRNFLEIGDVLTSRTRKLRAVQKSSFCQTEPLSFIWKLSGMIASFVEEMEKSGLDTAGKKLVHLTDEFDIHADGIQEHD